MAKKNAFNPQHQSRSGEQQNASGDKSPISFAKKEIKVEEKPIIVNDIKSKYTVSNKPIRVYVYFYEENGELKYTLDKAVVVGRKFEEEWFEFNRDTWLLREVISLNSVVATDGNVVVNPLAFILAKIIFLLKSWSLKVDLNFSATNEGVSYISNIKEIIGSDNKNAINDCIVMAINDCINTFYRG